MIIWQIVFVFFFSALFSFLPLSFSCPGCLWKDHWLSALLSCEFIVGWLSWQQEETLSIWTITVAMETKFLFSINNLACECATEWCSLALHSHTVRYSLAQNCQQLIHIFWIPSALLMLGSTRGERMRNKDALFSGVKTLSSSVTPGDLTPLFPDLPTLPDCPSLSSLFAGSTRQQFYSKK